MISVSMGPPPPKEIWMKFLKYKEMLNLAFIESDQEHFKTLNMLTVYSHTLIYSCIN